MASVARYCCCDDPCVDCSNDGASCSECADSNELTYTILVSGMTMCPCLTSIGGRTYTWIHANPLNGTHTITQTASACIWELTYTAAVREDQYVNSDCTGGISATSNFDVTFRMSINSATAFFEVELANASRNGMFSDEPARDPDVCCELPSFVNDIELADCDTNGPPLGAVRIAYGGSITVSC